MGTRIKICKEKVDKPTSVLSAVQKEQLQRKPKSTSSVENNKLQKKTTFIQASAALMDSVPVRPKYSPVPVTYDPDIEIFNEKYNLELQIGKGGYGSVYSATRRFDHLKVAVKQMILSKIKQWTKDPNTKRLIPTEVALLHECQAADGVIRLIEYFESTTHALIIMERNTDFVDLFNFIAKEKSLSPPKASHVVRQVTQTLVKCQSLGVIHRDLKQENVLINEESGDIRLLDFGLAQLIQSSNEKFTLFKGTAAYRPPEHIKAREAFADSLTVWSIGCFAYSLFFGDVPFQTDSEILAGIVSKGTSISNLSSDCRDFIVQCLNPNPESRPLLQELLNHQWISSGANSLVNEEAFQ